jgi:hypothetical protein
MYRKLRNGEKFDFEKMKSEVKEKYGITYDDTTLCVLDILREHIEKLSQGREYELIKLLKEIEFLKTFAYTVKKEQEARDKLASGNIRASAGFIAVIFLAAGLLFWRWEVGVTDDIGEIRSSINLTLIPSVRSGQQLLDSILHKKSNGVKER